MKRLPTRVNANVDASGRGQGLERDVHDMCFELRQLERMPPRGSCQPINDLVKDSLP